MIEDFGGLKEGAGGSRESGCNLWPAGSTHTHILLAVRHVPLAFFKGMVLLRGKPGNGSETGGKLFIID